MTTIAIASGKGGVGKTTTVANVGLALAKKGKSVLLIDADVAMANLSLVLGLGSSPITLHEVLLGDANIEDAIYEGPAGIDVIPSGLSLENYRSLDSQRLSSVVTKIKSKYDFVLIDVAAGIEKSVQSAIESADQVLIVVTPDSPSIADALKTKIISQKLNSAPIGIIINLVRKTKGEIEKEKIMRVLELPSYGVIPFDEDVRQLFLEGKQQPIILRKPNSSASKAFNKIALKITGVETPEKEEKESFLKSLLNKIFKK